MDQQDERDSHAVAESDGSSNADAQAPKRDQQDERDSHAVADSDGSSSADAQAPKRDLKGERDALRMISYGLYILTTAKEEKVHAITCNWVTQISFDPTLLLVAIEKDSYCYELLQESGVFALSFLGEDQSYWARRMATPYKINPHKLVGVAYHAGVTSAPILDDAIAFLECEIKHTLEIDADHILFVGEIVAGAVTKQVESLTLLTSRLRYK